MNYVPEISPVDGAVHRQNCLILQACLQSTTLANLRILAPQIFEASDSYYFLSGGPVLPRRTYVVDLAKHLVLVVLNGMENYDKVASVLAGWSTPQNPNGTVDPYGTAAMLIRQELLDAGILVDGWNYIVIGHSYGGACAPWTCAAFAEVTGVDNTICYTYGAPKTNSQTRSSWTARMRYRRVYHTNDPVPSLPPTSGDLNQLWLLVGVPTARLWSNWRHQQTGYKLRVDGSLNAQETQYTPINWPGTWLNTAALLASSLMFGNANHSVAAYQTALLGTAVPTTPSVEPAPQRTASPPPPPPVRILEERRDEAFLIQGVAVAADPQAAADAVRVGIPLIPGERFRGGYAQGHPAVYYAGQVVMVCKTKRNRRAVVRYMNRTL